MKSLGQVLTVSSKTLQSLKVSPLLVAVPFFVLSLSAIADVIREGDQASFLDAALQLASGRNPWHANFYNYDKQYFAFWIIALVFKVEQVLRLPISEIYLANLTSCLILWSGAVALLTSTRRHLFLLVGILCVVAAPSFLLQAPFLSTAAISSGFLLWMTWCLLQKNSFWMLSASGVLAFAAIGARADAVLAIPFLLWLTTPIPQLRNLVSHRSNWMVVLASILAIALGKVIFTEAGIVSNSFFWYPRIFVGYFVFGLGAAGILFLCCVVAITQQAMTASLKSERLYLIVGSALMLLPFLFYAAQLLSIRYWMLTIDVLLCFLCTPRGQLILQQSCSSGFKRSLGLVLVCCCILPLFVGVKIPFIKSPYLTTTAPTVFPTADGVMPMGAYSHFLIPRLRNAATQFVDHNQATWQSANSAQYELGSNGKVPVLETHLPMFIRLAATMQGKPSELIPTTKIGNSPFFYAESRSFTKEWVELNNPDGFKSEGKTTIQKLLASPAAYQSDRSVGIGVLKFGSGNRQWSQEFLTLNPLFRGNEYQILPASQFFQGETFTISSDDPGKTLIFYSPESFSLTLINSQQRQILQSTRESDAAFATIRLRGADWFGKQIVLNQLTSLKELKVARSAFPDWMSVGTVSQKK